MAAGGVPVRAGRATALFPYPGARRLIVGRCAGPLPLSGSGHLDGGIIGQSQAERRSSPRLRALRSAARRRPGVCLERRRPFEVAQIDTAWKG